MNKAIGIITVFLCFISFSLSAQHEYDNWYFGKNAAIQFINGTPVVAYNSNMDAGMAASSISDRNTGKLLFYTNGAHVWNKQHTYMLNDYYTTTSTDVIIIPYPKTRNKYYLMYRPSWNYTFDYVVVDISGQNGLGVVQKNNYRNRFKPCANTFVAMKHAIDSAFWFVSYDGYGDTGVFYSYKVTDDRVDTNGVESRHLSYPDVGRTGEMTTSNDGKKIGVTYFHPVISAVHVFDFNKYCGTVDPPVSLPVKPEWKSALGICFSPDDKKLYVTFTAKPSYLVQYSGPNYQQWEIIDSSDAGYSSLALGPDKQMYIALTNADFKPTQWVGVIKQPNLPAKDVGYINKYLNLGDNRNHNYRFPKMINDLSYFTNMESLIKIKNICIGDTTLFSFTDSSVFDSLVWDFGDILANNRISAGKNVSFIYSAEGTYTLTLKWYKCGVSGTIPKKVTIIKNPEINWPSDTVFCYKGDITLNTPFRDGDFTWSTQETSQQIKINKKGNYWVKVKLGSCSVSDTISISELPPILINLGGNYTICDDDNELVQLDAGKGFEHYKWTPTGDTTQWIIVKKAGDYFVVVEDFRGCKGDDGSRVNRLCDFTFYMPNAFTPDGNGLNDVFMPTFSDISDYRIEIFNKWGELVFKSSDPSSGWDGNFKNTPCPAGIYIWKASYKGHHNKLFKNFNNKGIVNLIR